jgi:thiol-disulfide isomerase/thioredoxin
MKHKSSLILLLILSVLAVSGVTKAQSVSSIKIQTDNGEFSLDQYRGQVIYLDFWASWCAPCKKSFPWLNRMQARHQGKGFKVIAVNLDKDRSLARRFLKNNPARFEIGFDPEGNVASQLNVQGMPSSFLIDRNGNIVSSHVGFREKDIASVEATILSQLAVK